MSRRIFLLALLPTVFLFCGSAAAATPSVATLPAPVRRVVFLGDSITYGGFYVAAIETYFLTRHPAAEVEFINVGLSSETVSGLSEDGHAGGAFPRPDLHERLARVLAQTKPDLVFACYGMNDGIYLPFAGERFAAFQSGLRRLRDAVLATGATLVHVTPPVYVDVKGAHPAYAAVLDRYSDWLVEQRASGWSVADLHRPMARDLAAQRARDPAFTFARDGVHPGEEGHWIMAREILRHLGARDLPDDAGIAALLASHPAGAALLQLVRTRSELMRDAWLTAIGHTRPKVKPGLPLPAARERAAELGAQIKALQQSSAPRVP
jgi:lysophospholipase L1-like esterase